MVQINPATIRNRACNNQSLAKTCPVLPTAFSRASQFFNLMNGDFSCSYHLGRWNGRIRILSLVVHSCFLVLIFGLPSHVLSLFVVFCCLPQFSTIFIILSSTARSFCLPQYPTIFIILSSTARSFYVGKGHSFCPSSSNRLFA